MAIIVTCTCGKQFKVKDELAGKRGKCAACGRVLSVPTLASSADQEKASPSPRRACPTCRQALQPKAVICLNCGLDLRTGKQVPQAKSSAPAAPSRPSAKAPASSARLWIALIAGGVCLAGVVAAVTLLFWGRGPGISAIAPPPNPGTQNAAPVANAPPGPVVQSASPKVDVPVTKKEGSAIAPPPNPGTQNAAPWDGSKWSPQKPEKKVKFTQALVDKILAEKMTEPQVAEILGARRIMTEAQFTKILHENQLRILMPGASRVLIWEDSVGNLILIEFIDGKARGGYSKIYLNR
jgi:hypothetical protein